MDLKVTFKVEVCEETFATDFASESLLASMQLDVLIKVCFLSKSLLAIFIIAHIGFLIGVDPEVVKKVVPFPETFATLVLIAFHDFYDSLGLWIFESENSELLKGWHVLLYFYRS